MSATKPTIPSEWYEVSAREAGWIPSGECRIEDLDDLDRDVVESMVFHREPEFYNLELGEPANAKSWRDLIRQQKLQVFSDSYRIPSACDEATKVLLREFREFVIEKSGKDWCKHNDCQAFRDPVYQGKFENIEVPDIAVAAVIYDGGPIAPILNLSYGNYKLHDAAVEFFDKRGYWVEAYTHWWSWIYKSE